MDKEQHEAYKQLAEKVKTGKATFKERNIWNIIQKRKRKGQKIYLKLT